MTRSPIVAGMFYEASPTACRQSVREMLATVATSDQAPSGCVGGLVPHAGWICSGTVAALTFKTLLSRSPCDTMILFGAAHSMTGPEGQAYDHGHWRTPLGDVAVDEDLASAIVRECPHVVSNPGAHSREHSLEVQIPFLQELAPHLRIVPIVAPPTPLAEQVGEEVGGLLARWPASTLVVGSTDLTHYGPRYGITPAGGGDAGLRWAEQNDTELLGLIADMDERAVLHHTARRHSACGGGAIAATIAACRSLGASRGHILRQTNSYETLRAMGHQDKDNVVGYASVVFA